MPAPEDPLERSAWYKAKAAAYRRIADYAQLSSIREAYEKTAKSYEALADDAERAYRRLTASGRRGTVRHD